MFNVRPNKKKRKRIAGSLRRTQLITTHGPGAIVDLPYDSVIIGGIGLWRHNNDQKYIIGENNLEKLLGVDYFVLPKTKENEYSLPYKTSMDVPAFRFPEVLFCSNCETLAHYSEFGFTKKPKCPSCRGDLIPSRFVVACEDGHLDDFPYKWWVHRGEEEKCENPGDLHIYYDKRSGGLESIKIRCRSCELVRSMEGCFNPKHLQGYKCKGKKPWLGEMGEDYISNDCDKSLKTLQRGASNLYFPVHASALSIPPWSRKIQVELSKRFQTFDAIWEHRDILETIIKKKKLDEELNCSVEKIIQEIEIMMKNKENERKKTYQEILEEEYRALTDEECNHEEFKTIKTEVPDLMKEYCDDIVLVKRLREVMALCGFKRLEPEYDLNDKDSYTELGEERKNWLPAIELKGEGIFIKFNETKIKEWEDSVSERYNLMKSNLEGSFMEKENFSSRYVLLHTFAHLLIRELILKCGYSSSALKERIYTTYPDEGNINMAGVLIYTSTSDSDGSLGGVVREGETKRIDNTLRSMLENANWCSSDPICIQSMGQGTDSLNYAACHSCVLLPETSCEINNCLLDRCALIGSLTDRSIGFFSKIFENRRQNNG